MRRPFFFGEIRRPPGDGRRLKDRVKAPSAQSRVDCCAIQCPPCPARTAVHFLERQKGNTKSAFQMISRLAITGKEPDQNGTAPLNEKYRPCLPEYNESNQYRSGCHTRAALPVLSRSKPRARGLTAGLRTVFWAERQVRKRVACFFLKTPLRFGPKEAAVKVWRNRTAFHPLPLAQTVNRHGSGVRPNARHSTNLRATPPRSGYGIPKALGLRPSETPRRRGDPR